MKRRTLRSRKLEKPATPNARRATRTRAKATPPKGKAVASETPTTRKAREVSTRTTAKPLLAVPPILLEGDQPAWPAPGAGETLAPGPTPSCRPAGPETGSLPEAYGTGKLSLLARDPHWLYAHWDLTPPQQRQYNTRSADRHLVVRVQPGTIAGHAFTEIHVHPESRSWFIHVEGAATRYTAKLGYYPANREWVTVASSGPAVTPADTISRDKTLRFATIPPEAPLRELAVPSRLPQPAESPLPSAMPEPGLVEVIQRYQAQARPASSIEIPELIRGPVGGEGPPSSLALAAPVSAPTQSISSPMVGEVQPLMGFWLNVNAELVLYGGTEPGASVTIGGRPIALGPDGTFSFRFALPDGSYELTVSALSTRGDSRQAQLSFTRRTECQGEVGTAPPDPSLEAPAAENV